MAVVISGDIADMFSPWSYGVNILRFITKHGLGRSCYMYMCVSSIHNGQLLLKQTRVYDRLPSKPFDETATCGTDW